MGSVPWGLVAGIVGGSLTLHVPVSVSAVDSDAGDARAALPTAEDVGMAVGYGLMETTFARTGDVRFFTTLDEVYRRAEDEGWMLTEWPDNDASSTTAAPVVAATGSQAAEMLVDISLHRSDVSPCSDFDFPEARSVAAIAFIEDPDDGYGTFVAIDEFVDSTAATSFATSVADLIKTDTDTGTQLGLNFGFGLVDCLGIDSEILTARRDDIEPCSELPACWHADEDGYMIAARGPWVVRVHSLSLDDTALFNLLALTMARLPT